MLHGSPFLPASGTTTALASFNQPLFDSEDLRALLLWVALIAAVLTVVFAVTHAFVARPAGARSPGWSLSSGCAGAIVAGPAMVIGFIAGAGSPGGALLALGLVYALFLGGCFLARRSKPGSASKSGGRRGRS